VGRNRVHIRDLTLRPWQLFKLSIRAILGHQAFPTSHGIVFSTCHAHIGCLEISSILAVDSKPLTKPEYKATSVLADRPHANLVEPNHAFKIASYIPGLYWPG
jgi:hypothetical protein